MVNISVRQRCSMESTTDDSPLKARFFALRKEIYYHYKEKKQTEQQAASVALKRSMSECEWESETDRLIKNPSHEDFGGVERTCGRCLEKVCRFISSVTLSSSKLYW